MDRKKLDQYRRILRFWLSIAIVLAATLIFINVWEEYYNAGIVFPFYYKGYWLVGAFYAFFFALFSYIYGGMKFGYLKNTNVIFSQGLSAICANVIAYLQTVLLAAKFVSIYPMVLLTLIDIAAICIWSTLITLLFKKLFPPREILLLYQEYDPTEMLRKMRTRKDRYEIKRSINVDQPWEKIVGEIDKFEAVFLCDIHSELRNRLLKYCYEKEIRVYITPKISDILIRSSENIHLFDTPLLLARNTGLNFEQKLMKRAMDIVISLFALIITSPVMLITALAIKLYDGGPVMFRQKRCTIHGKTFYIHKFRSMIVNAESEGEVIPATDHDPRITPVGNFIRKTRIDELPQMIDILVGNMSVVGPRPERVEHVEKYTEDIPEFTYRLKVKGGLTGYAQIYGKYNTTAYDKLKLDLMYIQNYSVLLDIKLILMTIKIIFMKESTEGFVDNSSEQ